MGHYLFIKLLKIEDNEKINLNKIVDNIRLKIARYKEVDKNDGRNRRVMILSDVIVIFFCLIFSSIVGNNFKTPLLLMEPDLYFILGTVLTVKLSTFYLCNLYRGMWRYTSITDVFQILFANFLAAFFLLCIYHFTSRFQNLSYEILFIDFMLTVFFTCSSRLFVRLIYSHLLNPKPYKINFRKRVILIGAGKTGEFICRELLNNSKHLNGSDRVFR